jgi:hypothetical protein
MNLPDISIENIERRLRSYLPPSWFGDTPLVLDTTLTGIANILQWIYTLEQYVNPQLRIKTATGSILDLIAEDFFGDAIVRQTNEDDDSFRLIILSCLLREKATRPAMESVIEFITGYKPLIIESAFPEGTFVWDVSYWDNGELWGGGDGSLAYQCFIIVYMSGATEIAAPYSPWDSSLGAYDLVRGQYTFCYADDVQISLTQELILRVINLFKVFGTVCWVKFEQI